MSKAQEAEVSLNTLLPWDQNPRKNRDPNAVDEMKASLTANGQFQPLLVTETDNGLYYVVEGETRRQALASLANEKKVAEDHQVRVWILPSTLSNKERLNIAIAGNTVRRDLDPIDQAEAFTNLLKSGMSERQVADAYLMTPSSVRQRVALGNLVESAKDLVRTGQRTLGWAKAMTIGTKDEQQRIVDAIATNNAAFMDSNAVKMEFTKGHIPVSHALFDPAELADCISRDLFEANADHFTDKTAFWEAQRRAVDLKIEELSKTHARVDFLDRERFDDTGWTRGGEPSTSVAIIIAKDDGSVEILQGMVPPVSLDTSNLSENEHDFLSGISTEDSLGDETNPSASPVAQATTTSAFDKTDPRTSQYLNAQISAGLRTAVATNPNAAKALIVAGSLVQTGIVQNLLPTGLPIDRDSRTAAIFTTLNNLRSARDAIVTGSNLTSLFEVGELVSALLQLPVEDLDTIFAWAVADNLNIQADSKGVSLASALGTTPMSGWRIEQTYLDTLTTPQLRELASEVIDDRNSLSKSVRRSDLIDRILQTVAAEEIEGTLDGPASTWMPPQILKLMPQVNLSELASEATLEDAADETPEIADAA